MLKGVILNNEGTSYKDKAPNLLTQSSLSYKNLKHLNGNVYKVIGDKGGTLTIHLPQSLRQKYDDFTLR